MQEDDIQATRDQWLRLDSWTPRQAFLLISKADPDSEGCPLKALPCFGSEFDPSEAFETYEGLERIWCSGSHGNGKQPPSYFIEWARQKGFDVLWLETNDKEDIHLNPRAETTYLNIIGGLLELIVSSGAKGLGNETAIIQTLLEKYPNIPGLKKRTLEGKFSAAKKSLAHEIIVDPTMIESRKL